MAKATQRIGGPASDTARAEAASVPFIILTGWLGAGKTTTLNRMLNARHGRRIAVLVNELGRIAIDTKLIVARGSDVLELAGGCVCCKVDTKSDLWDGIADVVARSKPEVVVLETTGIAEPTAILEGMHRIPAAVRGKIFAAGVVTVVEADDGARALATREEARDQVMAAERILLTKLDMAPAAQVAAVHAALDVLAPAAERASFANDDAGGVALTQWLLESRPLTARALAASQAVPLTELALREGAPLLGRAAADNPVAFADDELDADEAAAVPDDVVAMATSAVAATAPEPAATRRAAAPHRCDSECTHALSRAHLHPTQIVAGSFVTTQPVLLARLLAVLAALGPRLVRAKGLVAHIAPVAGAAPPAGETPPSGAPPKVEWVLVEHAGRHTTVKPWSTIPTPSRTELVVIADDLDEAALRRALWATQVGGSIALQ